MKIKLNIQSIRIAEALLKKPFGSFSLADEETAITLMYGMTYAGDNVAFTLGDFKNILKQEKTSKKIQNAVTNEMAFIQQFNTGAEDKTEPTYMGELADLLILSGMDAHYVNYEMELFEIAGYMKTIDNKKREQMENDRFWTFLSILPHVDHKKLKSPLDLITFPWESEEQKVKREKEIEEAKRIFKKFIKK